MCDDNFCIWTGIKPKVVNIYDFSEKELMNLNFRSLKRRFKESEIRASEQEESDSDSASESRMPLQSESKST